MVNLFLVREARAEVKCNRARFLAMLMPTHTMTQSVYECLHYPAVTTTSVTPTVTAD